MLKMRKCIVCGDYTLSETHCNTQSESAHPKKYDPNDKFGDYRRTRKGML